MLKVTVLVEPGRRGVTGGEFADTREDVDGEVGEVSPGDHGFEISWSDNHLGIGVVEVDNSHIES